MILLAVVVVGAVAVADAVGALVAAEEVAVVAAAVAEAVEVVEGVKPYY